MVTGQGKLVSEGKRNHDFSLPQHHGGMEIDFIQGPDKILTDSAGLSKQFPSSTSSAITGSSQIFGYLNPIYIACPISPKAEAHIYFR